jgi:hypothetical protein
MALNLYSLTFSFLHSYAGQGALSIPLTLTSAHSTCVDLLAKLDTGSTYCIFSRSYSALPGLDLYSGIAQRMRTATGAFQTYGHEVTVSVFDLEWQAVVYFAESDSLSLNVLGRFGFLDRLRIAVVDYDEQLYLGLYGQE